MVDLFWIEERNVIAGQFGGLYVLRGHIEWYVLVASAMNHELWHADGYEVKRRCESVQIGSFGRGVTEEFSGGVIAQFETVCEEEIRYRGERDDRVERNDWLSCGPQRKLATSAVTQRDHRPGVLFDERDRIEDVARHLMPDAVASSNDASVLHIGDRPTSVSEVS